MSEKLSPESKNMNLKYYLQQSETNENQLNAKRSQYLVNPIICEVIFGMTMMILPMVRNKLAGLLKEVRHQGAF